MQRAAVASVVGARLLSEIEEGSLEELLSSLRTNFTTLVNSDFNDAASHDPDHCPNHDNVTTTTSSQTQNPVIASTTTTTTTTTTKTSIKPEPRHFPIPFLNELVKRHFRATGSATLSISGRYHELLYLLVATLIAPPNYKTVAIVDFEGRFDVLRLLAARPFSSGSTDTDARSPWLEPSDLNHVHILRPPRHSNTPGALNTYLAGIEEYMLYAPHKSREREWWGSIVIGSSGNTNDNNPAVGAQTHAQAQVAVTVGWQGWLRVDRAEVSTATTIGAGAWTFWNKCAEEARREREGRQEVVEEAGWVACSAWGTFVFGSGRESERA